MKKLFNIEGNEFLEISVNHREGGCNYFSGGYEEKGVQIVFSRVTIEGNIKSVNLCDKNNYRILVKKYNRKSSKAIKEVEVFIEEFGSHLYQLYLLDLKQDIFNFLQAKFKH